MPRKNLAGTFEGSPAFRWTRMVRGVRWRLLCRPQMRDENKPHTGYLGLPESQWTKEGSQAAANDWWEKHQVPVQPNPVEELNQKVAVIGRAIDRAGIVDPSPATLDAFVDEFVSGKLVESKTAQTVGKWRDEFLALKKADGGRRSGRFDNLKRAVDRFVASLPDGAGVDAVTEENYRKFFKAITSADHSAYYKHDTLQDVKTFIKFLYQERQLSEPLRNLDSLKVKIVDHAVQSFTVEELRLILRDATGPLRLFVWLFANCGMRQKDVSSITHAMYAGGYLTRKRGKTADHARAPKVSHKLWPETLALIEQHRTTGKGSDLLFLQENGKPWVMDDTLNKNERRCRDDNFAALWRDFVETHPQRLPAKHLRGSAANLIQGNNQISLQVKFLADVPSGVILKHYIDPTQEQLDEAITGLRTTIGKIGKPQAAKPV
ncbi:hypothetical protein [Anatilimnocola floriformis]|uniref:hypothetical protein n=1 Tax=Anatilimnocola floriformis TaxID=2948575 RepID=UPI0020C40E93|nr:hypothetical protein [Anatilimnocola floriformis]